MVCQDSLGKRWVSHFAATCSCNSDVTLPSLYPRRPITALFTFNPSLSHALPKAATTFTACHYKCLRRKLFLVHAETSYWFLGVFFPFTYSTFTLDFSLSETFYLKKRKRMLGSFSMLDVGLGHR